MQVTVHYAVPEQHGFRIASTTVKIAEVTSKQAPLALIIPYRTYDPDSPLPDIPYRYYQWKLWSPIDVRNGTLADEGGEAVDWRFTIGPHVVLHDKDGNYTGSSYYTGLDVHDLRAKEAIELRIQQWARSGLIIDGVYHREKPEPRYFVQTLTGDARVVIRDYCDPGYTAARYFGAHQYERAIRCKQRIAKKNSWPLYDRDSIAMVVHQQSAITVRQSTAIEAM